jgi:hypothetical protein
MHKDQQQLSVIQKTHDLIAWYIPILHRLPKDYKFSLGMRVSDALYVLLEGLIEARYNKAERLQRLQHLNIKLEILRHQTRLLYQFGLFDDKRLGYANRALNEIGAELGGWIKREQNRRETPR